MRPRPTDLLVTKSDRVNVAVYRSTLIRGLDRLRARRLITTARGQITIVHPQALRDLTVRRDPA